MKKFFLGIDQGTHSSRAQLFDERGHEIASAYESIEIKQYDDGRVEQAADEIIASVKNVVKNVLGSEHSSSDVVACGIATQRSTVLGWDNEGNVTGPVLSWQDVRGADKVEALRKNEVLIREISGLPLSAHYGASKMRCLLDDSTEDVRVSPLISYLLFHLLKGKPYFVDHSNAQRTQLMDVISLNWSSQLTGWFGVPVDLLPTCMPMYADYGLLAEYDIPVTTVCGDQNAAVFGSGDMPEDIALVNIGSGAFILRLLPKYIPNSSQLTGIGYSDEQTVHFIREGTVNGAGSALNWLEKGLHVKHIKDQLNDWLNTVSEPPILINTVGGLGSPWWRHDIEPAFIGAELKSQAELAVAVVESILFMVRANLELMIKESPVNGLRVSGGLSNSDALCQKLADLCMMPVERINNAEATVRGVAWLAAGKRPDWEAGLSDSYNPSADEQLHNRYMQFMDELNKRLINT